MSSHKLTLRYIHRETAIVLLLLVYRLLLLRYVLIVCHNKAVKLVSFLRNAPSRRKVTKKNPNVQIFLCFEHKKRALALGVLWFLGNMPRYEMAIWCPVLPSSVCKGLS